MTDLLSVLNLVFAVLMCALPAVGIVVTAMARRRHGRAATIGLLGCVALLLQELLGLGRALLHDTLREALGVSGLLTLFTMLNLVAFVLGAIGIGLLIWAVVARRTPRPAAPGWQPPQARHPHPAGPYQQPAPQQSWQQPPS